MEYMFYGRDREGAGDLRRATIEEHWRFTDSYVPLMIARGPTLSGPGGEMTGSLHIVDLPDAASVKTFAYDEPFYRAGVFGEYLVRPWRNRLGRTMWDFSGSGGLRFMIFAQGDPRPEEGQAQLDYLRQFDEELIAYGPVLSDDGDWVGSLALIEVPDRSVAQARIAESPEALAGFYSTVEVHDWRFGGRPDQSS